MQSFDELTARKREVASLIACGLTNRQIAENLVIFEETVTVHVKHILNKWSFTSRAQVAAWIVQKSPDENPAWPQKKLPPSFREIYQLPVMERAPVCPILSCIETGPAQALGASAGEKGESYECNRDSDRAIQGDGTPGVD